MFKDKRISRILKMRKEGQTLKEIGKRFHLTGNRIRQLEIKGIKRLEDEKIRNQLPIDSDDIRLLDLGTRAINCLRNANIKAISKLKSMNFTDLLRIRNLGIHSLREIEKELRCCEQRKRKER